MSPDKLKTKTWAFGEPAFDIVTFKRCYIIETNDKGLPIAACYNDGAWVVRPFKMDSPTESRLNKEEDIFRFIPSDHPIVKEICKAYNISPRLPKKAFEKYKEEVSQYVA